MIVMNTPEHVTPKIFQLNLSRFNGWLSEKFLDQIVAPARNVGVNRKKYFIIKTDEVVFRFIEESIETQIFMYLMHGCEQKGFKYLMLIK